MPDVGSDIADCLDGSRGRYGTELDVFACCFLVDIYQARL